MFLKLVLLFLVVSFTVNYVVSQKCGVAAKSVSLIHRGSDFKRGKYPWMVALMLNVNDEHKFFCGGVLVSKTKVLTASHCIQDKQRNRIDTRDILLLFGAHDLNNRNQPGVFLNSPSEIIMHPDWNPFAEKYDADIAAIIMEYEIPYTQFIRPICIASGNLEITEGYVAGWGKSEDETKIHENMPKELKIPVSTNEDCFLESSEFTKLGSKRTFCAGSRNGSGVCHGDSGGGLFAQVGDVFYLKGIVSASLVSNGKCDVSNFALFTDVTKMIDWIDVPTEQVPSSLTSQKAATACGIMSASAGLIQNGIKSTNVQWPWAVILFNKQFVAKIEDDTYSDFEIGTLISDKHIIGDGLYFSKEEDGKRMPIANDLIKSYFGVINLDDYSNSHSLVVDGAENIFIHPNLGFNFSLKYANFAIIQLKNPIRFSQHILPICLSNYQDDPYLLAGRFAYAVGMGYSATGKTKDRKHAPIRLRSREACAKDWGVIKDNNSYFCAGGDGRSNACWSDHPLYLKDQGKWFLHGFFQIAYNDGKGCRSDMPVLYELASLYFNWILNKIGGL